MNKVILMGRLTRDPDVRYSQGENAMAIARYTLAVDRRTKGNKEAEQTADFISCVTFGKTAEFVEKYLKKGTKVAITGRIMTGSYTNKDGQKVYTTEVCVEEHEFAESRQNSAPQQNNGGYQQQNNGYQNNGGYQQQNNGYQNNGGYQQQNNGYQNNGGYQQQNNGYQNNGGYQQQNNYQQPQNQMAPPDDFGFGSFEGDVPFN
jgi:single-strand DNA-binding protein